MSVPPLVCSTPPPPDQVEEEGYNDDFTYNYVDLSPTHQFEDSQYPPYDTPSPRDKADGPTYVPPSNINITFQQDIKDKPSVESNEHIESSISPADDITENIPNDIDVSSFSEDCNVEDLDLKLDSLHLDFENERVTVEESLNSTFDDFGIFLSNTDFIPKLENNFSESDKESKSHGTCSEDSTSLHNEDWDNISQNSFNNNLNTITDQQDGNFVQKDNNDNIPKHALTFSSPDDNDEDDINIINKEESVDSGFKSSVNNSSDQIHSIKPDQLDSKSDVDVSVTDANTLSFSESNDLDKNKTGKDGEDDLSIEGCCLPQNQINDAGYDIEGDEFAPFSGAEVDFKANFNDDVETNKIESNDFGSFIEAQQDLQCSYPDSKTDIDIKCSEDVDNDEFRESDDFGSFTNAPTKNIESDSCSNNENIKSDTHIFEGDDFEDFAEFKAEPVTATEQTDCTKISVQSDETSCENVIKNDICIENKTEQHTDDDFGDFDTYDPSIATTEVGSKSYTVNDLLLSNDTDIIQILKTAVSAIYQEDVGSEETVDDYQLLSSLGGSWKHLKEYETKQSYIFPWNNSSSQKTLLKSLGIDSRNILFGTKWNSNMPRFAANLGVTPLQPIKQSFPASSSDYQREDKLTNSADEENSDNYTQHKVGDWQGGDSFSMGDNQASSYAESLLLDLEHLMATLDQMTSGQSPHFKISDLFTNACSEREDEVMSESHTKTNESGSKFEKHQPPSILNIGRKINLPDTHIFTPTDSETPWSHTIHYEDPSTNFVPSVACNIDEGFQLSADEAQSSHNDDFDEFQCHDVHQYSQQDNALDIVPQVKEQSKGNLQTFPVGILENRETKIISGRLPSSESDDFGDFHSAATVEAVVHHTDVLPPTSVLQPVRVTPSLSVPVVNWPAPGDVDTSVFQQLSDLPITQSTLPPWVENQEQPSWVSENKLKFENKDLHIPPFVQHKPYSPATSFILKETRIDSVATEDNINDLVVKDKSHASRSDLDDFTNFQSVSPVPTSVPNHNTNSTSNSLYNTNIISTTHITNNTAESVFSSSMSANDDFNDFQGVQYNPSQSNYNQINTTSFISTPQRPNYFLPSTLGGSFLKSENSNNFSSTSLQPSEETSSKSTTPQQQQILQPLSLENYSQINWPNPGIDLQDLSRFNPINSIHSYSEPKETKVNNHHSSDDDGWSDFVSIKSTNQPTKHPQHQPSTFNQNAGFYSSSQVNEEDDWSDFVSGTVLPSRSINEVKTISQNIHSQTSNNIPATFARNATQNLNNPHHLNSVSNITALPHLSYASKVNSKSNFLNL